MGARKHNRAEAIKEARKSVAIAHLNNVPTSPYKMRLVADMIRGMKVELALHALQYSTFAIECGTVANICASEQN